MEFPVAMMNPIPGSVREGGEEREKLLQTRLSYASMATFVS